MSNPMPSIQNLPFGAEVGADGVWRQVLTRIAAPPLRPALFLDRDGVMVEEVHYLCRAADTRLENGAAEVIRAANRAGVPVVVVTNQSGIGRGKFGWDAFAEVQEAMLDALADAGAYVNAVYACPHHKTGVPPYNVDKHPARKPEPGMLLSAAEMLPIDLSRSWIVGDKAGDLGAGRRAGCAGGLHVLSGHGAEDGERRKAREEARDTFEVRVGDNIADALGLIPLLALNEEITA